MFNRIRETYEDNPNTIWKWVAIGLGGIATLVAGIFTEREKDTKYERALEKEVRNQSKKMLGLSEEA